MSLFGYKSADVYIFWVVNTNICDNIWSKGISSGCSKWRISCQPIECTVCSFHQLRRIAKMNTPLCKDCSICIIIIIIIISSSSSSSLYFLSSEYKHLWQYMIQRHLIWLQRMTYLMSAYRMCSVQCAAFTNFRE